MSTSSTRKEFQGLLANLHERDLTSWERERLWEIFETHPEFILEYQEHCQLPAMFAALEDEELLRAGMTRPPRNIVSMPGAEQAPPRHSRRRSRSRVLRLAGLAAVLVAGAMALPFLIQNEPSITMPAVPVEELEARLEINGLEDLEGIKALAEAREMAAADDREGVQENRRATASAGIAQAFPSGKRQAAAVSRRRSDLVRDDPADEGVALQGAAALANSRSPRGGESSGVHGTVPAAISFNHHVRPILSENCFYCHGPDESERKSGLRLDTPKGAATDLGGYAAIVPGDIAASELWARITASDADELMPPADSHRTLSSSDKEILRRWIEAGAEYEIHWAFQKPSRVAPPEPAQEHAAWPVNPIDQFVLADLEAEGLAPSPPAKARTLARRLHLDTTGLPPDPGEVDAFEKAFEGDPARAVSERVDALLDSPHYGEKMALAWLDAARYADSNGFLQDGDSQQWPWRDWVVRAWNQNMPFDRFTIEQLAGDLLEKPSNDQLVATAFNRNHMLNGEGGAIAEEQRINYVIDRVDTTATTWLGLTMACAQCHSHKYDPITHRDYYQFFAFFNNIPETGGIDRKSGKRVGPRNPVQIARPYLRLPDEASEAKKRQIKAEISGIQNQIHDTLGDRVAMETKLRKKLGLAAPWTPLVPTAATADHQDLAIQGDHSIAATGPNPDKDDYSITYKVPEGVGPIRHVRLEALQNGGHTNGGKGLARSDSGNFVLTSIEISVGGQPVPIASGRATYEQGSFVITKAFDDKPTTGWAVHRGKPNDRPEWATFTLAQPIEVSPGIPLQISLHHQSKHKHHNIGRFRIAASSSETLPSLDSLEAALALPANGRGPEFAGRVEKALREGLPGYAAYLEKIDALEEKLTAVDARFSEVMIMEERKEVRPTYILDRGSYEAPTDQVTSDTPAFLPPMPADTRKDRLGLARWLVSPENPLVSRVAINRLWAQLFGAGLVKTSEDFGVQGELPSHPELLDWLAVEFIDSGWNVKHMMRLMLTSRTYSQAADVSPEAVAHDPENRLLARASRYRLPAMLLRDQALALGGLLRRDIGGRPVYPHQPEGLWKEFSFGFVSYPHKTEPEQLHRRSLYTFWRRTTGPPNMFDSATRQICTVKTAITNTPLHALTLLNDVTYIEAARGLAGRMAEAATEPEGALAHGFEIATGRSPDAQEQAILIDGHRRALDEFRADPEAAQAYVGIPDPQFAAYTRTAQVILNLDETLNRN